MIILIRLCGFLFLFIMFLNIPMGVFGKRVVEIDNYDSDAWLQNVNKNPKKYKLSILLALIEHALVITLTIILFIVFGPPNNIILGILWVPFRMGEGLAQIYDEKNYWRLFNIARQHSVTNGTEKKSLSDSSRKILQTIKHRYIFVGLLWASGTLPFSILLVTYELVPLFIGWLGIVASISLSFGNGIEIVKPNFKVKPYVNFLTAIGGLGAILFEVILGGWLLFYPHITP